jgi:curved DNA-binding protein
MSPGDTTLDAARALLGVAPGADEHVLRKAFRAAAKLAHPDRAGGDAARFRAVLDAYHALRDAPTAVPAPTEGHLTPVTIDPAMAVSGGVIEVQSRGRQLRLTLPPGMRAGDKVRAGGVMFRVCISAAQDIQIRGDDLWMTCSVEPSVVKQGGRVSIETPLGRRIVWVTERAGQRGLVRVAGQGLPARGDHPKGDLFLRLEPTAAEAPESAARILLRRFAAAWAA